MPTDVTRRGFLENALLGAGVAAALPVVFQPAAAAQKAAAAAPHPLDPLTADEIEAATTILEESGVLGRGFRFISTSLLEPAKAEMQAWKPGQPLARLAQVVLLDRESGLGFEAIVDLGKRAVAGFKKLPAG